MRQVTRHMNPASDQLGPVGLVVGAEDNVWADQIRSKNAGINARQTAASDSIGLSAVRTDRLWVNGAWPVVPELESPYSRG